MDRGKDLVDPLAPPAATHHPSYSSSESESWSSMASGPSSRKNSGAIFPTPSPLSSHTTVSSGEVTLKGSTNTNPEDQLWSILPSYYMYTDTIQRNLSVPDQDNDDLEPPVYACFTPTSVVSTNSLHETPGTSLHPGTGLASGSAPHHEQETTVVHHNATILADENTNTWRETILDNVMTLKDLTNTTNEVSNAVDISFHFTKDVGRLNEEPEFIDPLLFEYKEGDFINGYVLIKSRYPQTITFEMFYLLFEGTFIVANAKDVNDKRPVRLRKFLEMFDFSASWNEAQINRLVTENYGPHCCSRLQDPLDKSFMYFAERNIYPDRLYKRFFTFKIPSNLLDSECNEHGLSLHVEMPPTIGLSRYEDLAFEKRVKDLSMIDTSVSYGVLARFIGRKSKYKVDPNTLRDDNTKLVNSKGDEYIILKEASSFVRILQQSKQLSPNEKIMKKMERKLLFDNLFNRVKQKIETGNQLVKSIKANDDVTALDISRQIAAKEMEFAKLKQTYVKKVASDYKGVGKKLEENYEIYFPLIKKSFTGSSKVMGTLKVTSPKREYIVDYIPPARFRTDPSWEERAKTWNLEIPLDISFSTPSAVGAESSKKLVEVKRIYAELAVTTLKTDKFAVPIEFDYDLIYNKNDDIAKYSFFDEDSFTNNVIKPMRAYSTQLHHLLNELGSDNFKIEKGLVEDMNSISQMQERSINLPILDMKVQDAESKETIDHESSKIPLFAPWRFDPKTNSFHKKLNLLINIASTRPKDTTTKPRVDEKTYDRFCLVPNFQSCYISRIYHIRIQLILSNNKNVYIKVPVMIEKT